MTQGPAGHLARPGHEHLEGDEGGAKMSISTAGIPGPFCWIELAASDAERATAFYGELFGWPAHRQRIGPVPMMRLTRDGADIGSLYPLGGEQRGPACLRTGRPTWRWRTSRRRASCDRVGWRRHHARLRGAGRGVPRLPGRMPSVADTRARSRQGRWPTRSDERVASRRSPPGR